MLFLFPKAKWSFGSKAPLRFLIDECHRICKLIETQGLCFFHAASPADVGVSKKGRKDR
jgi:hypothetical protein